MARGEKTIGRYSLEDFIQSTGERDLGQGVLSWNENALEVNLNSMVWTKMGSMVALHREYKVYSGRSPRTRTWKTCENIPYKRRGQPTKAEGRGKLCLADKGKKVSVLKLENDSTFVN
jgi:uncharacterized protein (AIM24 family)